MTNRQDEFQQWAQLALARYPLRTPQAEFIRHSDNLTFLVRDARGKKYVLRLHKPVTINFEDLRQEPRAILSELQWMDALRREARISIPVVRHTRDGKLVATLQIPGEDREIPCSLLSWVDGEPFQPETENASDLAFQLGRLMARMHAHASNWRPPDGFLRPRYGPEHVDRLMDRISTGVQIGLIRPEDFATVRSAAEAIRVLVAAIPQTPDHWSLIHNDLHTGNWLWRTNKIYPIDFALCAFGYQLFDIATCCGSLGGPDPVPLRLRFFDGYREVRPLLEDYLTKVEAFFLVSVLGYYAFILPNPQQHEWISEHFPRMVRTVCSQFLRDEHFLLQNG
ncbi:MAG: phosphotransferase [Anaerolineales bacterium]|nr:phosphotransferase [Anaerolineales bacterium]